MVVILYDGMGSKIIDRLPNGFFNSNKKTDILSVFPSTTTAATTSVLSGLNPNSHGWLGWDLYFKMVDKTVTMFTNNYKDSEENASEEHLANKYYGYENILNKINKKSRAYIVSPFCDKPYANFDDMLNRIKLLCQKDEKKFIYAYLAEPDHSLHLYGTDSDIVLNVLKEIDEKTEKLCNSVKDTLFIIIADHGHINSDPIYLDDYEDIFELLERTTSIEPRACNIFVKEDKKREFKELFNEYFKDDFLLLTKEEVITEKIFGIGEAHEYFYDSIGDYLAISINDKHILYDKDCMNMISMHAGITEDEMLVPLIVVRR